MSGFNDATTIRCPKCNGQSRVLGPGKYACPLCNAQIQVLPDGSVALVAAGEKQSFASVTCAFHPERHASAVCQGCGKLICPACSAIQDCRLLCPECRGTLPRPAMPTHGQAGQGAKARDYTNPWEDREALGVWKAAAFTVRDVLLRPGLFFSTMGLGYGAGAAYLLGLLTSAFGGMLSMIYTFTLYNPFDTLKNSGLLDKVPQITQYMGLFQRVGKAAIILSPINALLTSAIQILFTAVVIHFFLMIVGGAKRGFEATFKVVSFSAISGFLLVIPSVGSMVAFVWQAVLMIVGCAAVHGISTGRSAAAVLLPMFVLIIVIGIAVAALLGVIFGGIL